MFLWYKHPYFKWVILSTMNNVDVEFKNNWFDFMGYKPHVGQHKLHFPEKNDSRFVVAVCGRRW